MNLKLIIWLLIITLLAFLGWSYSSALGQTVRGTVNDALSNPIPGANIYLKGSYDGAIADSSGKFEFTTGLSGNQILVISHIQFESSEIPVHVDSSLIALKIILKEAKTELSDVVITAGTFEAGDKKRGFQLKTLDILTTANSNGDIFGALNTLPGTQTVGEEGGLFVRGGEKYETKTFVDGMLVSNPYSSKVPDLPQRGRFSPSLFNGVSFSSGGYSAEYGQALSSALVLQTNGFPAKSLTSVALMPFGAGLSHTWRGDSTSFSAELNYSNMVLYNSLIKQKINWKRHPEGLQSTLMFRKKTGRGGFIKSFGSFSTSRMAMILPNYLASEDNVNLQLSNQNIYVNTVYTKDLPALWTLKTGIAFNYDEEPVGFESYSVNTHNHVSQARVSLQKDLSCKLLIKTGFELDYQKYDQKYSRKDSIFNVLMSFKSTLAGIFLEAEWKISKNLFARLGSRFEYSVLLKEPSLVPRVSLAYKTGEYSQCSIAYGMFTELPKEDYLKFTKDLSSEKATHYMINYQYSKNDRLGRIEAFVKDYADLTRYTELNDPDPKHYNNEGYGYARGIEVFFRDQKTLRHGDYWVSYTYLDTRKFFQNLSSLERPYLFSKHNLILVGKYFVVKLNTQFGFTYQYSSGRPYYVPEIEGVKEEYTKDFHNISANLSYLTSLWHYFTIVHFSVSNILGLDQVYSYHFSKQPDANGNYTLYPVKPSAKRFFVLGIFMTLK